MANRQTIKNWFKRGLKPTQQQFWDVWDSYWHKDEFIPVSKIESLDERFDEKADRDALNSHMDDLTAHGLGNLIASLKTSIPATEDFSIHWQTDIVEGDIRTFAQKHGNNIAAIDGVYEQDGVLVGYKPGYNYTVIGGAIQVLNLTEVFTGTITIL